ncbi:unnamed protein product [Effrenium voratum]|nr:unnamed protein product [Effrenium voratum]
MLCRSAASALPATAHWPCGAPRAPRARTPPPRSCRQWPAALAVLVCRHYRPGRCRVPRAEAAQGKAASAGRNSRDARNAKDLPSEDAEVWQPRGALEPVADLAEMLLPDLIISNMEKITRHTSSSSGFPAFIEHSKIVTAWDVQRQRAFGGKLLRQTIPEPLTQLCSGILKTLQLWPEFYGHAIRFGAATIGAVTSHWLVGETRVLSEEEEQDLVQKLRHEGMKVSPDGVMLLRKCKFIAESGGCKNLCLNLCKAGTEEYMAEEFGFPVRMVPNFKDQSCAILLMEKPVRPEEDPLFSLPCGAEHCDNQFAMPARDFPLAILQERQLLGELWRVGAGRMEVLARVIARRSGQTPPAAKEGEESPNYSSYVHDYL